MTKNQDPEGTHSLVHLLHRASQCLEERFDLLARDFDITARQVIVLDAIAHDDKPSQTDICAQTGIDRSTLADIMRRLETKRFLTRRRSRQDARRYSVRLTESGKQRLQQAMPLLRDVDNHALGALTLEERSALAPMLRRIAAAATAQEPVRLPAAKASGRS